MQRSFTFVPTGSTEKVIVLVLRDDQKLDVVITPENRSSPTMINAQEKILLNNAIADLKAIIPDALDKVPVGSNPPVGMHRWAGGVPAIDSGTAPPASLKFWMRESMNKYLLGPGYMREEDLIEALREIVEKAVTARGQQANSTPQTSIDKQACIGRITTALGDIAYDLTAHLGQPMISLPLVLAAAFADLHQKFLTDPEHFSSQDAAALDVMAGEFPQSVTMQSQEPMEKALEREPHHDKIAHAAHRLINNIGVIRMDIDTLMQALGKEGQYKLAKGQLAVGGRGTAP